jgi:hypothetical protein
MLDEVRGKMPDSTSQHQVFSFGRITRSEEENPIQHHVRLWRDQALKTQNY